MCTWILYQDFGFVVALGFHCFFDKKKRTIELNKVFLFFFCYYYFYLLNLKRKQIIVMARYRLKTTKYLLKYKKHTHQNCLNKK